MSYNEREEVRKEITELQEVSKMHHNVVKMLLGKTFEVHNRLLEKRRIIGVKIDVRGSKGYY